MKKFCENYKIAKYKQYIRINDVIENVLAAKNKSYYTNKINIDDFKIFNNEKYVTKNTLVDFLGICKNKEAKTAIEMIQNKKKDTDDFDFDIDTQSGTMTYNNQIITINTTNNQLWIRAKDITSLLGFNNTNGAISKYVDDEDICKEYNLKDDAPQRKNSPIYINESGFYALVLNSEHKQSKQIKRWITKTVLPTIRKTGSYNHHEEVMKLQTEKNLLEDEINQLKKPKNTKPKKNKETIPKAVRIKVWSTYIGVDKADGKCFCCRDKLIYQQDFQCGYVQSECTGGRVNIKNLRPLCGVCHRSMGTKNMHEFMEHYGFDTTYCYG